MSVLDHVIEQELTRVPSGPSADELRRRVRVRRARRVGGSVAVIALVLAGVGIGASLRSPATNHIVVTQPSTTAKGAPTSTTLGQDVNGPGLGAPYVPPTTPQRVATPVLEKIRQSTLYFLERSPSPKAVGPLVVSAKIVATTRVRADALLGGLPGDADQRVWVVEVVGTFPWVCDLSCPVSKGGVAPQGREVTFVYDSSGKRIRQVVFGSKAHDLGELGTVYRLQDINLSISR